MSRITSAASRLSAALGAVLLPAAAWAGSTVPQPLPEPETWALLAIAGVAAVVIGIRNKRK